MRQTFYLIWKEWRETRWFLIIFLLLALGFSGLEMADNYRRNHYLYTDLPVGLVLGFGGALAIFLAVAVTTRDLRDPLEDFWRSRPIGLFRWLTTKYIVGLLVLLLACTLPILGQLVLYLRKPQFTPVAISEEIVATLALHTFTLLLIFTLAFALGCLLRHATHAALLAMAGGLLVYFLPLLLPPLSAVSVLGLFAEEAVQVTQIVRAPRFAGGHRLLIPNTLWALDFRADYPTFLFTMLTGSAALFLLAYLAVRRDWRLELGKKLLYWTLGSVLLLLMATMNLQIGSNLKTVAEAKLPADDLVGQQLHMADYQGVLVGFHNPQNWIPATIRPVMCTVRVAGNTVTFGRLVDLGVEQNWYFQEQMAAWLPEQPERVYVVVNDANPGRQSTTQSVQSSLWTVDLSATPGQEVIHRLDLSQALGGTDPWLRISASNGRVYVSQQSGKLAVIDVTGDVPRLREVIDSSRDASGRFSVAPDRTAFHLPDLPGLNSRERLQVLLGTGYRQLSLDGDVLISFYSDAVKLYRPLSWSDRQADFGLIGQYRFTPLERITGLDRATEARLADNWLYLMGGSSGISVFDASDPTRLRRAGHFARPRGSNWAVVSALLPDGRLLAITRGKAELVAPPQRKSQTLR